MGINKIWGSECIFEVICDLFHKAKDKIVIDPKGGVFCKRGDAE